MKPTENQQPKSNLKKSTKLIILTTEQKNIIRNNIRKLSDAKSNIFDTKTVEGDDK